MLVLQKRKESHPRKRKEQMLHPKRQPLLLTVEPIQLVRGKRVILINFPLQLQVGRLTLTLTGHQTNYERIHHKLVKIQN